MNLLPQKAAVLIYHSKVKSGIKKNTLAPIEIDIYLIKNYKCILTHYNYPLDKPIIVSKQRDKPGFYIIRDGNHRYQKALELGYTKILCYVV